MTGCSGQVLGAVYGSAAAPSIASPGEVFTVTLDLTNAGWLEWDSHHAQPVLLSYHWQDRGGRTIVHGFRFASAIPNRSTRARWPLAIEAIPRVVRGRETGTRSRAALIPLPT